jgi:hypothetical protein
MSVPGRPHRASVWRPPGEVKALEGSAAPTSGALALAARQLGMSEQDIFDLALARSAWPAQHGRGASGGRPHLSCMVQDPDAGAHEPCGAGARVCLRRRRPGAYSLRRLGANGAGKDWGTVARRLGAQGGGTGATVASLASEFDWHLARSRAPGLTTGEHGAWSSLGGWHAKRWVRSYRCPIRSLTESTDVGLGMFRGADLAGRAGMEGGAGPAPAVPSPATDVRGQPVLIVVQDAELDSRPSCGAQAAHPEGDGALVARVAAGPLAAHRARLLTVVREGGREREGRREREERGRELERSERGREGGAEKEGRAEREGVRGSGAACGSSVVGEAGAAACELCPPLFPLTHCAKGGTTAGTRLPFTWQQASDWIRWAVKQARGNSSRFSASRRAKGAS